MQTTNTAPATVHTFQNAGLGIAPFKLSHVTHGSDNCQFCGTAIVHRFHLTDANGATFFVGSDCVLKSGDAGLIRVVEREVAKRIAAARKVQDAAKVAAFNALIADPDLRAFLATQPHPTYHGPVTERYNLLTYTTWIAKWGGKTAKIKLLRTITKLTTPSTKGE